MNYASRIETIQHFNIKSASSDGSRVRVSRKSFVIDCPTLNIAERITDAINNASIDDGVNITRADTGVRMYVDKGSVFLREDQCEEIAAFLHGKRT